MSNLAIALSPLLLAVNVLLVVLPIGLHLAKREREERTVRRVQRVPLEREEQFSAREEDLIRYLASRFSLPPGVPLSLKGSSASSVFLAGRLVGWQQLISPISLSWRQPGAPVEQAEQQTKLESSKKDVPLAA